MAFLRKHGPSFIGHIIEGQILALMFCALSVYAAGFDWWTAYGAWGLVVPVLYFYGREKRDCETALKLRAGDPRAYYLLWTRPSNVSDLIGNPIFYAAIMTWGQYAQG